MLLLATKPGEQLVFAEAVTGEILGSMGYEPVTGSAHKIRMHIDMAKRIRVIREAVIRKSINDTGHTVDIRKEVIEPGLRGEVRILYSAEGRIVGVG